jgi:ATP-binding cassette subfamily B protein
MVTFSELVGRCNQALWLIAEPHSIKDSPMAMPLVVTAGNLCFDNVSFAYRQNRLIFQNLSTTIHAQQRVGLVGFSGAGKSTFVNLITRTFEIQGGCISIDGQDIRDVTQKSLRQHISFIPQDTILFHRTLRENIAYGSPMATENEVIEAAKKAHAHDFITNTEHGYQTIVGERGMRLSGGQRQRIAIARAFLKNAPILILDEATSSLDSETEVAIHESLNQLMHNRTTMVIAHRLSTLMSMNRILVFEMGTIVEDGTHQELIDLGGIYARLWHTQIDGFIKTTSIAQNAQAL